MDIDVYGTNALIHALNNYSVLILISFNIFHMCTDTTISLYSHVKPISLWGWPLYNLKATTVKTVLSDHRQTRSHDT